MQTYKLYFAVILKASLSLKITGILFPPTALKKKMFAQNKEVQEMARNNFIMMNLRDMASIIFS